MRRFLDASARQQASDRPVEIEPEQVVRPPDGFGSGFTGKCVLERIEARDLIDIAAVMRLRPELGGALRRAVAAQDALLLAERLLGWTEEAIRNDLRAYPDVDPGDAFAMRDRLLELVKETAR